MYSFQELDCQRCFAYIQLHESCIYKRQKDISIKKFSRHSKWTPMVTMSICVIYTNSYRLFVDCFGILRLMVFKINKWCCVLLVIKFPNTNKKHIVDLLKACADILDEIWKHQIYRIFMPFKASIPSLVEMNILK